MEFDNIKKAVFIPYWKNGFLEEMNSNGRFGDITEMALITTEVSEAIEDLRQKEINKEHLAEECADIVIRVMNFCNRKKIDLEKAIIDKNEINSKREFRHGKAI